MEIEKRVELLEKTVKYLLEALRNANCQNSYIDNYEGCRFTITLNYDMFNEFLKHVNKV